MTSIIVYAPMKRIDPEAASGVQQFPALIVKAAKNLGLDVQIPDLPTTYEREADKETQSRLLRNARAAIDPLTEQLRNGETPRAWLTYHNYYKSPDVIGPEIARRLGVPYLIVEGSHAPKRAKGRWAEYHALSAGALASADVLLTVTERDAGCLSSVPGAKGRVVSFPPFIDPSPFLTSRPLRPSTPIRILAAGSMSDPRKIESYRTLFEALEPVAGPHLELDIAGDGANLELVQSFAGPVVAKGLRTTFHGRIPHAAMPAFFASGDIFAWPGIGEAFGLTYLEAQAAGLPVAAEPSLGVDMVISHFVAKGASSFHHFSGFFSQMKHLISDPQHRISLGRSAQNWVLEHRSMASACRRLAAILDLPAP